ncbi:MAG: DNA polymerase III subunit delta [Phycisphaerales bacterium]
MAKSSTRSPASAASKAPASPAAAPPIALFHGPDRFQQIEQTEELRTRLRALHGELAATVFDGASASPADILDECRSLSLMQQHRFVVVDNADALVKGADEDQAAGAPAAPSASGGRSDRGSSGKTPREILESYAAAPDASATLVLRAGVFRGPKLEKAILAAGGVVRKCEPLKPAEAVAWAISRATSHHATTLERPAALALLDAIGPELGRIDCELAKLALMVASTDTRADKRSINDALVRQCVGITREEEFWAIQGSLLSGDPSIALTHLRSLLDISRHDPTPLFFTFGDLARKLHAASQGLASRENPFAVRNRLRLWGPDVDTLMQRASRIRPGDAAELVRDTVQAMVRQRTGDGDPEHILEGLTLRFASACRV